jgi:16S rRNA (cytidine1402-2'-O)-methyltransferase
VPLFLVATPIGNLSDLSARARDTLAQVDAVIAEDTRHSGQLLNHLGLKKPMLSLPAFDEAARIGPIVARLVAGKSLALVTDAGTPAISDPGALLVRAAIEAGIAVVPIPGPSAAVAAVSVSGFAEGRFHFAGFLPRKGPDRAEMLRELKALRAQLVFYEAPGRLHDTLLDLATALGDRPALVARELTKLHEELARGRLSQLAARFEEEPRGELVVVVAGVESVAQDSDPAAQKAALESEVRARLANGERPKEIAEALALAHGKREVYQLALKLRGG